ncbi:MAG: hypothetical protein FRX48_04693 [Lasallia pustulata]|uniref:C2 domain-containing protein n=1 Tax=Lasallia pustulata TaxID=136370 RepID=A0A5M8PRU2_9LECA|nr:MAG: hypothetical protein FRX48_04693 [Lasallia pustulata]
MAALTGAHTAGIYADMTVDGPEIGTLVVIVDRAKNLPNRKTMGKQDPYCAARLGKEAKKTETDRRGGQTPRWDQELRFTVHDSPDYYQLKVSVFNDDKRTDLIGETWVPLDKVVVPGGGQNDLWHNLNCKGRYAGEIRIELTYYDIRPKEEPLETQQQESLSNGREHRGRDSVGGPRQAKPVKRRPLPPDPTDSSPLRPAMPDHTQSSPLPYRPSPGYEHAVSPQPQLVHRSVDYGPASRPVLDAGYQHNQVRGLPLPPNGSNGSGYSGYEATGAVAPVAALPAFQDEAIDNAGYVTNNTLHGQDGLRHGGYVAEGSTYGAKQQEHRRHFNQDSPQETYQDIGLPELPPYNSRRARLSPQPPAAHSAQGNAHSSPGPSIPTPYSLPDYRERTYHPTAQAEYAPTQQRGISYEESPLRYRSVESPFDTRRNSPQATMTDEGTPPPPPAHRDSGLRPQTQSPEPYHSENYRHVAAPAPLKLRTMRSNASGSPLSQVQTNQSHHLDQSSVSPVTSQSFSYSGSPISPQTSFGQPVRRQSQEPTLPSPLREYSTAMPPSLVPGYDPTIAEDESQRMIHETRTSARHRHSVWAAFVNRNPSQHEFPPQYDSHQRPHASTWQASPQTFTLPEDGQGRGSYRAPAPIIKPRPLSPDPRTPIRKSVSPQPEEARPSSVPFSPDSYETFNPKVSSAPSSVNQQRPRYQMPEQAKEAAYQAQREIQREEGPIISADGRVIDPSDHLPAETWAPEPERKTPRKGPEVTLRFRHSPQGAQPMPPAGRRPPRDTTTLPQSVSTPIYASTPVDSVSPLSAASASRNRLQKKIHGLLAQQNSSPLIPTLSNRPSRSSLPRASVSEYPLREHENYGYNSSPTYARNSPIGPPPIPAKVPLPMGQEDYGMNTLSEEISRIDIGVGGGGMGRARRSRFGP